MNTGTTTLSTARPRRQAATIPIAVPRTKARMNATPTRNSACGCVSVARRATRRAGPPVVGLRGLGPALSARTDPGEREDVVGERREDRVAVEVLRIGEAMEVPGAVRRPPRSDEQRHDRQV